MITRKKLILDLRRSHSQETVYWKPSSDLSSGLGENCQRTQSATTDKKTRKQKSEDQQRPKSSMADTVIEAVKDDDAKNMVHPCINEQDFAGEDIRRGKRRKKIKTVTCMKNVFFF